MKMGQYIVIGGLAYFGLMMMRKQPQTTPPADDGQSDGGQTYEPGEAVYKYGAVIYERYNKTYNEWYGCQIYGGQGVTDLYRVVKKTPSGSYEPMVGVDKDSKGFLNPDFDKALPYLDQNAYTYTTAEECKAEVDRLAERVRPPTLAPEPPEESPEPGTPLDPVLDPSNNFGNGLTTSPYNYGVSSKGRSGF